MGLIEIKKHDNNDDRIIAKIKGEEAELIRFELENGAGIHFQITLDDDNNTVVELHKEKWIIENLPDDKKKQNDSRHSSILLLPFVVSSSLLPSTIAIL